MSSEDSSERITIRDVPVGVPQEGLKETLEMKSTGIDEKSLAKEKTLEIRDPLSKPLETIDKRIYRKKIEN